MKFKLLSILAFAAVIMSGCNVDEGFISPDAPVKMKSITLAAAMPTGDETRAAISSEDGSFTWQAGDKVSVLATDNRFYNLSLAEGAKSNSATFSGVIPENE